MNVLIGPFSIAAALLVIGGVAKSIRPGDTAVALRLTGVPVPLLLVRMGGGFEAGLGVWALLGASRVAAVLVALSYLGFLAFVAQARVRGLPIASCGCFGRVDTPPSPVHLVFDALAVVVAVAVAIDPGDGIARVVDHQPAAGVPYIVLLVLGTAAALAALTALPRALGELARSAE